MKKVSMILMGLLSLAFSASAQDAAAMAPAVVPAAAPEVKTDPKAELKITEFTGDASVTFGADLDNNSTAMSNATSAKLTIELAGGGDKATKGDPDAVWGDIKIKTDGDPVRAMKEGTLGVSGYKIVIDYAKLHWGKSAYIGVKGPDSAINYAIFSDAAARYIAVNAAKRYGQIAGDDTYMVGNDGNSAGPEGAGGLVFGLSMEKLLNLDLVLDSLNAWVAGGTVDNSATTVTGTAWVDANGDKVVQTTEVTNTSTTATPDTADLTNAMKNRYAFRGTLGITAVENLTLEGAFSTGFGGSGYSYDTGFGGKLGYKVKLDDKMYLKPNAGLDAVINNAKTGAVDTTGGDGKLGYVASAGLLIGWGDKGKTPDLYFFRDDDNDQGFYPGLAANVVYTSADVFGTGTSKIGLNLGFLSGKLIDNVTAVAAFDVVDVTASTMEYGLASALKYTMKSEGTLTVVPKAGISYHAMGSAADFFAKAGLELNAIFPNTNLSIDYASNDMIDGVTSTNNTAKQKLGMVSTTLKITF